MQSTKLIVSTQQLRASHMACNETAHALMFKVKIGSKSAITIQFITMLSSQLTSKESHCSQ